MKKPRSKLHALLGSRKPVLAARLLKQNPDGSIQWQEQAEAAREKAKSVIETVQDIFEQGANKLTPDEWDSLFAPPPSPSPDLRWTFLVRLAVKPVGKEGDLRDQFVALPDGTPFSLRLLLIDQRWRKKQLRPVI